MIHQPSTSIRQAEIAAALALGSDLGVGKPLEDSLRTCLLALGIAKEMGLDGSTLSHTYKLHPLHPGRPLFGAACAVARRLLHSVDSPLRHSRQ